MLLSLPSRYWCHRHVSDVTLVYVAAGDRTQALHVQRKHSTNWPSVSATTFTAQSPQRVWLQKTWECPREITELGTPVALFIKALGNTEMRQLARDSVQPELAWQLCWVAPSPLFKQGPSLLSHGNRAAALVPK